MVTTDERLSRLEGAYEQVDGRLGDLSRSFEAMRTEMNQSIEALRNDMNSRINEMNSRINNLYMVTLGLWVTTIIAIVGLYFRS